MIGVIANALAVLILGFAGSKIGDKISKSLQDTILAFIPIAIMMIGVNAGLKGSTLIIIVSLVIGIVIGEKLDLEGSVNKLGEKFKKLLIKNPEDNDSKFVEGYVSATLIFCMGSMGILGSLDAGIRGFTSKSINRWNNSLNTCFNNGHRSSCIRIFPLNLSRNFDHTCKFFSSNFFRSCNSKYIWNWGSYDFCNRSTNDEN